MTFDGQPDRKISFLRVPLRCQEKNSATAGRVRRDKFQLWPQNPTRPQMLSLVACEIK